MASGEGTASTTPAMGDFGSNKQGRDNLEGLMSSLSHSIKSTNWLKENTAERWAEENPEAYEQWMEAIKERPQQSSASQTAVAASESTGSQTASVSSQHTGSQTPSASSQTSSSQTNVAAAQDAGVP